MFYNNFLCFVLFCYSSNLSDADILPSLENSLNMQQFMPSSPVDEFKKLKNSGSHLTRSPNKEYFGSKNFVSCTIFYCLVYR